MQADLPELAAQDAHKALEISPQLPQAHFMLGEVYLYKSDVAHALEEFEQERAINPASSAVYDRLGDVYTRTGQYQQAEEALTRAISLDVSSTGPFIQMGKVFLRRNDPQSAAIYLQHAEKMDPANYITHTLLGQAYRGLGKEEDAKRELDIASLERRRQANLAVGPASAVRGRGSVVCNRQLERRQPGAGAHSAPRAGAGGSLRAGSRPRGTAPLAACGEPGAVRIGRHRCLAHWRSHGRGSGPLCRALLRARQRHDARFQPGMVRDWAGVDRRGFSGIYSAATLPGRVASQRNGQRRNARQRRK